MTKPLTVASMRSSSPTRSAGCEIPDGRLPGLYPDHAASGARERAARYRYAGRSPSHNRALSAFDLAAARQEASQALQRAQRGGDPAAREEAQERRRSAEAKDDFESIIQLFIERHSQAEQPHLEASGARLRVGPESNDEPSAEAWPAIKGGLVAKWGERKIGDIARIDIIDLLDAIVARKCADHGDSGIAYLRKLFNWALESDLIAANPCAGVKPRAPGTSRRPRALERQLKALWRAAEAMKGPLSPIVQLLILTGQRREEVGGMRWSEVDLDERLWTLPASREEQKEAYGPPE